MRVSFTWRGITSSGGYQTGVDGCDDTRVSNWVRAKYDAGWKSLTLIRHYDGQPIGAILRPEGAKQRTWWADDNTPEARS